MSESGEEKSLREIEQEARLEIMKAAKKESFRQWLGKIDPEVTIESRLDTINGLLEFLEDNDVRGPSDLDGMTFPTDFEGRLRGGKVGLMVKVMIEVNKTSVTEVAHQLAPGLDQQGALVAIQAAVTAGSSQAIAAMNGMVRAQTSQVHVNMAERLSATTLEGIGQDFLPAGTLTDWLATEAQKERSKGILHPFIAADIRKWVQQWVPHVATELREQEALEDKSNPQLHATQLLAQSLGAPVKPKKYLSFINWLCGFRHAAHSYNASGMWHFTAILAHEQNCMQIAVEAEHDNRRTWLAVIYDHMARRKWHELAYANRSDFDVNIASLAIDDRVLKLAEKEWDAVNRTPAPGPRAPAPPLLRDAGKLAKAGGKGACFTCGEFGHIASHCPQGDGGKGHDGKGKRRGRSFDNRHSKRPRKE